MSGPDSAAAIGKRTRVIYGVGAVAAAWLGALALELLARMMANLYVHFGADLPDPTLLALRAVRTYLPWAIAIAVTLVVVFMVGTAHRYVLHACAVIGTVLAISIAAGGLALALPSVKMCGYFLMEWPDAVKPADQGPVALARCTP